MMRYRFSSTPVQSTILNTFRFSSAPSARACAWGNCLQDKWSDIDWHGKFIRVSRSYKTGRVELTKTGKVRHIDMSDQLADTLRKLLTARKEEALREGSGEVAEIIFHNSGKHMEQNYIRKIFKRLS